MKISTIFSSTTINFRRSKDRVMFRPDSVYHHQSSMVEEVLESLLLAESPLSYL